MSTNFLFNKTWELLNWSQALLKGGWGSPQAPVPEMNSILGMNIHPRGKRVAQLIQKYKDKIQPGTVLPLWTGNVEPDLLVVCDPPPFSSQKPLSEEEENYTHKWYEAIGLAPSKIFLISLPRFHSHDLVTVFFQELYVILQPQCLLTLGELSAKSILQVPAGLENLRGRDHSMMGCPLLPTYHPSQVLKNRDLRQPVWQDLQRVKGILNYESSVG